MAAESSLIFHHDAFFFGQIEKIGSDIVQYNVYAEDMMEDGGAPMEVLNMTDNHILTEELIDFYLTAKIINRSKDDKVEGMGTYGNKDKLSKSLLYVPIIWEKRIIGVLSVQSYQENKYGQRHLDLLKIFSNHCVDTLVRTKSEEKAKAHLEELEQMFHVTVGREVVMSQLKEKVQDLEKELEELRDKA